MNIHISNGIRAETLQRGRQYGGLGNGLQKPNLAPFFFTRRQSIVKREVAVALYIRYAP